MKKETYEAPKTEIIHFETEDVIVTSGGGDLYELPNVGTGE